MTGYKNSIQAYKNAFASVDKLNQVIMLYDGAIAALQQARQAIIDKNIEERYNKVSKAFYIMSGLRDAIDHASGGEIAGVLSEWYSGTILRIITINRTNDIALCEMCIAHVKQMRDAWVEAEKQVKGGGATESHDSTTTTSTTTSSGGSIEAMGSSEDFFTAAIKKAAYSSFPNTTTSINV